jgi:hypothetical protein
MREAETGFVVDDGDDAAQYMTFEMGDEGSAEGGDAEGQKKKGGKKRGALNAQVGFPLKSYRCLSVCLSARLPLFVPVPCISLQAQPSKRKKEDLPEVAPSHRISHMFLNAKVGCVFSGGRRGLWMKLKLCGICSSTPRWDVYFVVVGVVCG